jgi:iron complex outermembrane receptor protein
MGMTKKLIVRLAALCWMVGAVYAQEGAGGAEEKLGSRRASRSLEEIVVTARKREELLEDTPISVTALGAVELRDAGVTRLDDIETLVPNLNFQSSADVAASNIRIRGIGTPQSVSIAFDPGVGVYVDGVFLPRTIGTLLDVVDIQQVEVLRGPQGTLFGKNTVGGAINITTVRPHEDFEGSVLVRPGNRDQVFTRAVLNAPLGVPYLEDKLFTRFAFSSTNDRGYFRNDFAGEKQYWNDRSSLAFLGSLRFRPVDAFTFDLSGTWSRDHNHGKGGRCVYVRETALGNLAGDLEAACADSTRFSNSANERQLSDVESYGIWGTATLEAGDVGWFDDLTFKSISAWREQKPRFRLDADMTSLAIAKRASVGGGAPSDGELSDQQQVSTELQTNANAWEDRLKLVGGAFAQWETGVDGTALEILPDSINTLTLNERTIANWTWALYGQATLDVFEWLSLTGGVRFTEEKKGLNARTIDLNNPEADPILDLGPKEKFDAWTPMASVALSLPDRFLDTTGIDHLMGYFTYSRGFRGGGFNGVINPTARALDGFDPEYLDSFEIGFKGIALEERVTLNVALFLSKYDDIQVTAQTQTDRDGNGDGVPDIEQTTINAAKATVRGAEIELTALPIQGLLLRGSIGLLESEYDDFGKGCIPGDDENNATLSCPPSDFDGEEIDRSGESFNNTPKFNSNVIAQYSWEMPLEGRWAGYLTPRLEWYYQSRVHILGPEVEVGKQSGYNLLHARLSYDFLDERATIALWAKNLTDENYMSHVTPLITSFGIAQQYFQSPRTYGGEVSYAF